MSANTAVGVMLQPEIKSVIRTMSVFSFLPSEKVRGSVEVFVGVFV